MRIPVPELKCISQVTAKREGYTEITTPIHPERESQIFESLQRDLKRVGGVWIEYPRGLFSAGRKRRELLTGGQTQ